MAFKVSNKAFEEAFSKDNELSVVNSASEVVYKMIEHLKKYLSSQQKYPSAIYGPIYDTNGQKSNQTITFLNCENWVTRHSRLELQKHLK